MTDDISDRPIDVVAVPGAVVILSPQGPVAMTSRAALRSAELLIEAASKVMTGRADPVEGDD